MQSSILTPAYTATPHPQTVHAALHPTTPGIALDRPGLRPPRSPRAHAPVPDPARPAAGSAPVQVYVGRRTAGSRALAREKPAGDTAATWFKHHVSPACRRHARCLLDILSTDAHSTCRAPSIQVGIYLVNDLQRGATRTPPSQRACPCRPVCPCVWAVACLQRDDHLVLPQAPLQRAWARARRSSARPARFQLSVSSAACSCRRTPCSTHVNTRKAKDSKRTMPLAWSSRRTYKGRMPKGFPFYPADGPAVVYRLLVLSVDVDDFSATHYAEHNIAYLPGTGLSPGITRIVVNNTTRTVYVQMTAHSAPFTSCAWATTCRSIS